MRTQGGRRRARRLSAALAATVLLAAVTVGSDVGAGPPGSESTLVHPSQGVLRQWDLSPDGDRVVYTMRQHGSTQIDLYSVPTDGGPRVQLNESHANAPGGFEVTPDSSTVVWLQGLSLYSAPIDGGPRQLLAFPVAEYGVTADSTTVAYVHGDDPNVTISATAIDGSTTPTVLATSGVPDADGYAIERLLAISPDGAHVVFRQIEAVSAQRRLYAVPISGGTAPRDVSTGTELVGHPWAFSSDGAHLVFQAFDDTGRSNLYSADLASGSGGPTRLNDPTVETYGHWPGVIDDTGNHVVFMTASGGTVADGLARSPVAGGASTTIVGPLSTNFVRSYVPASPGFVLVELGDTTWHRVPTGGGTLDPITGVSPPSSITDVTPTPDGQDVLFIEKQPFNNNGDLRRMPIAGGPSTSLGVQASSVTAITADSSTVIFKQFDFPSTLNMVPITGGATTKLNGSLIAQNVIVPEDGDRVVFDHSNGPVLGQNWLQSVDLRAAPAGPALLRVTTEPAVPSQVTVNGIPADTWGLTWARFSAGTYEVCFTDLDGWTTPPCSIVETSPGVTATVTGSFTQRGQLRVLTEPAVPATITVDGVDRNDWGVWVDMEPGTREVCFGAAPGYIAPDCQEAVITAGATTTITGSYVPGAGPDTPPHGLLRVVTDPPVPAMISVDGIERDRWGLQWLKVGRGGQYRVCFGDVPGFETPRCQTADFDVVSARTITGTYVQRGYIRAVTFPARPSTIFIDGIPRNDWGVWTDVPTGDHEVCWSEVDGFAPPCQPISVLPGDTRTAVGEWPAG